MISDGLYCGGLGYFGGVFLQGFFEYLHLRFACLGGQPFKQCQRVGIQRKRFAFDAAFFVAALLDFLS